ncbi:MAG: hypothetical protein ABI779_23415 [Acidobacteriota bacterium]
MTRPARQLMLATVAVVSAALAWVTLANRNLLRDARAPRAPAAMALWLAEHPADWRTAGSIAEQALDSSSADRVALWRASYVHAKRLAPPRTHSNTAFVRAGLFHWYELGAQDRARVLTAAAPLMKERAFFEKMHVPLWELTHDMEWIRRSAPDTLNARDALATLAISRGLFPEYRALREDLRRTSYQTFLAERERADFATLLNLLPDRPERADEPLVRGILAELDRRAFEAEQMNTRTETLIAYAVRHHLKPLEGIRPLLAAPTPLLRDVTRAQVALELGDLSLANQIELAHALPGSAEWIPYDLDRARFAAKQHDAGTAETYLRRASLGGATVPILAAAEEVAILLGNDAGAYHRELVARSAQPRVWTDACTKDELCGNATTDEYVTGGRVHLRLDPSQSDETPAYVVVFIDDALAAETPVETTRTLSIAVDPGLHRIVLRLVNPRTRNGIQRRVRLS